MLMQSFTVCLQGFINAIVYAWTREDHLSSVSVTMTSKIIRGEGAELEVSIGQPEDTGGPNSEEFEESDRELETLADHEHSLVIDSGTDYHTIDRT